MTWPPTASSTVCPTHQPTRSAGSRRRDRPETKHEGTPRNGTQRSGDQRPVMATSSGSQAENDDGAYHEGDERRQHQDQRGLA
jgi:hypothetical protein